MSVDFKITLDPMQLDEGPPEERAAFGLFKICLNEASLTEGFDFFSKKPRLGPLVSGYYAAEWFAWNWWRQYWEPFSNTPDWALVHRMPSIGEGYVWPNITIFSDGVNMALITKPSSRDAKPFRFFGSAHPEVMPLSAWEASLDAYMKQICDRLDDSKTKGANLNRLWKDILAERKDPEVSKWRRVEAMLGREPGSGGDDIVDQIIASSDRFGIDMLGEIAANNARVSGTSENMLLTASDFEEEAKNKGHSASQRDVVNLEKSVDWAQIMGEPAWRHGTAAAKMLRKQEKLGGGLITNERLAEMAGTKSNVLTDDVIGDVRLSFILNDDDGVSSRLVMRSKWLTGRRFDLSRLIGDRLLGGSGALHPAMRTYTYRQKAQRAFAAEFLSPFDEVDEMLGGDYGDEESRNEVAERFEVSPMTIDSLLVNHGKLEREFLGQELDPAIS